MSLRFEWEVGKAAVNLKKHKVSFDEATTVFIDTLARVFDDTEHSTDEIREIIIGHSIVGRLLLVSFTERAPMTVRIISARKTTSAERKDYENQTYA